MLKRIVTILLNTTLGGSLLLAGSTAASAAPPLIIQAPEANPSAVILARRPVPVTITIRSDAVKVTLRLQSQDSPRNIKNLTGTQSGDTWTFHTTVRLNDPLGNWDATTTATGADASTTVRRDAGVVIVRAPTRIVGFTVRPRVVLKGKTVVASGQLQAMVRGRWRALVNRQVVVRFNENQSVTTDRRGNFSARAKPQFGGQFDALSAFSLADSFRFSSAQSTPIFVNVVDRRQP